MTVAVWDEERRKLMTHPESRQNDEGRIRTIATRLAQAEPASRKVRRDPLDELVLTILSQSTSDANCYRGWEALKARFPDWGAVLAAPDGELEETIRPAGLAKQKSGTILSTLTRLRREHGRPTLDHLATMDDAEAIEYLTSFKGVGVKTAACVLCFAMDRDVIPVDTHVHRIALRLGLVPEKASAVRTHEILNEIVPPELRYELHVLMIGHGRRTCTARNPRCPECAIRALCPRVGLPD
ncbi:MAG: endonuclease III [marine benthic group bacterium]|nr:endonuclease III [Candidatus Benthicola marisminoris]